MPEKRPKILLSAGMIQSGHSGVGRYVVELANRIAKMDKTVLHLAGLEADRHLFPELVDEAWITIPEKAGGGLANLIWHQTHLPRLLRRGRYDLLHIPSYRRVVANCPVPQLVTIHDCAPFRLRDKYGAMRGLFGRQVAPWLARRCDHVLTVSEFTKQDLVDFFKLAADGVEVVYNGLNHALYRPRSDAELAAFRARQGLAAPYFLYISRLEHPGKNHLRLIEAFEQFRKRGGQSMLVLGGAPWHGSEVIESRIKSSSCADAIHLSGFIKEGDLPLWYAAAEALVFPSLIEGFGLPVVEALACGTRVATSDRGSLPEVGGDASVYFDPEDTDAMAAAMAQLSEEETQQRDARLSKGFAHAARFDWDEAAKATCQSYHKLTESSDSG